MQIDGAFQRVAAACTPRALLAVYSSLRIYTQERKHAEREREEEARSTRF